MTPMLSIITPIYNGVTHIDRYFKNIEKINNDLVEFIIINDGSTDGSHQMVLERLKTFSAKCLYIEQDNGGAASARLNGIGRASGEYIALLDCDDELGDGAVDVLIKKINAYQGSIDCILLDLKYIRYNSISDFSYGIKCWPTSGLEAFSQTIDKWGVHGFGAFRKTVYLAAYAGLSKLTSAGQNQINDDELITRLAFYNSKQIDICEGVYLYNIETPSTTRGYNKNAHRMLYTSISLLKFVADEVKSPELVEKACQNLLNHTLAVHRAYVFYFYKINNKKEWLISIASAVMKLKELDSLFVLPSNAKELLKINLKKIHWFCLSFFY